MNGDMWVSVSGTQQLAERACRMVFGEDTDAGPVMATPAPLLKVLADWPKEKSDQAMDVALELPVDFDIEHEMGKGEQKAVVLRANRITVLRDGKKVGYALRTNEAGLNAIRLWGELWTAFYRRMRNAH
jgi:hypothetical protein